MNKYILKIWNKVDWKRSEKRSKTRKRLKEHFLIGRNRTKHANFLGSPLKTEQNMQIFARFYLFGPTGLSN